MYLIFEETGELTQTETITPTMEEEYNIGVISIARINDEGIYEEYCRNSNWQYVIEREIV